MAISVEDAYFRAWGKAGGARRLRRACALHAEIRSMLEVQTRAKHPELSGAALRRATARRLYMADDVAGRLIDRAKGTAMDEENGLAETLARVAALLEGLGARFHFTGGVAASYYGDPRFTQDLDVVIDLRVDRPEARALLDRLAPEYLVDEAAALEAIASEGLFQAIDEASLIKVDFHVGEKVPGELARSARREIFPGVAVPLVSQEDAILSKLLWARMGSHKARHDLKMMLRRDEELDRAALLDRARAMALDDLLAEIEPEP